MKKGNKPHMEEGIQMAARGEEKQLLFCTFCKDVHGQYGVGRKYFSSDVLGKIVKVRLSWD